MGALLDGFDAARLKSEQQIAAHHLKEKAVDDHLRAVTALLDQDATLLQQYDFRSETVHRTLRVSHHGSPVIMVHFDTEEQAYMVSSMRDGSKKSATTPEECAGAIGEFVFAEMTK